jgi:phage major head subunit gpT-like protein
MAGMSPNIPSQIAALDVTFHKFFAEGYTDDNDVWGPKLATFVNSVTLTDLYGWLERTMKLRKWVGPRVVRNIATALYALKNDKYEGTYSIDANKLSDSKTYDLENLMMKDLGRAAKRWPQQLIKTALQAGTTGLCYDGQAFFSTTHPLNPAGNQSNLFASGAALSRANLDTVYTAATSLTDPTGEPIGEKYDTLIVPPALGGTARVLVNSETISDFTGASNVAPIANPWRGRFTVLELQELANQPTVWYLAALGGEIKPLIFQMRQAPDNIVSLTNPTDPNVFFNDEFFWGVKGRGAAGYGPWWKMIKAAA